MVQQKAKLFCKKYHVNYKSALNDLKVVLSTLDCHISTYAEGEYRLITLKRNEEMKTAPALTIIEEDGNTTVYYNADLPNYIMRFALAHEIGHLYLNHYERNISEKDQEIEADKFADYILSYDCPIKIKLTIPTLAAVALLIAAFFILTTHNQKSVPANTTVNSVSENTISDDPDTYYWTDSGTVYHLDRNCYHIKNHTNVTSGTLSEAQQQKERLCKDCERKNN